MEKEIVLASERYLGKSVFPKQVEGVDIGAYLLVTFDGDNMEQLEELEEERRIRENRISCRERPIMKCARF